MCFNLKVSSGFESLHHFSLSLNTASNDRCLCWSFNNWCVCVVSLLNDSYSSAKCSISLHEPCRQKYTSQTHRTANKGQLLPCFLSEYICKASPLLPLSHSTSFTWALFITLSYATAAFLQTHKHMQFFSEVLVRKPVKASCKRTVCTVHFLKWKVLFSCSKPAVKTMDNKQSPKHFHSSTLLRLNCCLLSKLHFVYR